MPKEERLFRKETPTPPIIKVEDRWNSDNPELPFRVNEEKLSALAIRDFGFTPFQIRNITLVLADESGWEYGKKGYPISIHIGVPELYTHAIDSREGAKRVRTQMQEEDPETEVGENEVSDQLYANHFHTSMMAALTVREKLASAKVSMDEDIERNGIKRSERLAAAGSLGSAAAAAYLLRKGVVGGGIPSGVLSLAFARRGGRLDERIDSLTQADPTESFAKTSALREADQVQIDEWSDIFSFAKEP